MVVSPGDDEGSAVGRPVRPGAGQVIWGGGGRPVAPVCTLKNQQQLRLMTGKMYEGTWPSLYSKMLSYLHVTWWGW